jgi:hypothetical protein
VVEDRRLIGIRLAVLQYAIMVTFAALAVSFWVLQIVQNEKFKEMAENNHQRALALRARAGSCSIVAARSSSKTATLQHFDRSEQTKDLNRTMRLLASFLGVEESYVRDIVERHRRSRPTGQS